MKASELLILLQKVVDGGDGDAILFFYDTRSGVAEECNCYGHVENNVEMASGDVLPKGLQISEGEE